MLYETVNYYKYEKYPLARIIIKSSNASEKL